MQRYSKKMESRKTSPAKLLRKSNLPRVPSAVFNFAHQSSFSAQTFEELATGSCLDRNANIMIFGSGGSGKTHLCAALGWRWCMDGRAVYYCKAADLAKQICCVKSFEKFDDFEVIVFDDFCDVVGTEQGVSLLAFLESRQQQQRIVITSRVDIHKWETLEMHSGVIERLLDHVFIIQLDNCCMYPAPRKGA